VFCNVVPPNRILFSGGVSKSMAPRRKPNAGRGGKGGLDSLTEFLRLEMEGEERINLAMTSVGLTPEAPTSVCKKKHFSKQYIEGRNTYSCWIAVYLADARG
jgi:hypothetical protein